jgi:hypothetical protein
VDLVLDSILLFGRASLGGTLGLLFGTFTQGEKHVRWAIGWMLVGYAAGTAAMLPCAAAVIASGILLLPTPLWTFCGFLVGAGTLADRQDWYLRTWGWIGFLVGFHLTAVGAMAAIDAIAD